MNKNTRSMVIWWLIIAGIVVFGIYQLFNRRDPVYQLATSDFHQYIKLGPDLFDGYLVLDEEWVEGRFHAESLKPNSRRNLEKYTASGAGNPSSSQMGRRI